MLGYVSVGLACLAVTETMASFATLKPGSFNLDDLHMEFGIPPDGQMHAIASDNWVIMGEHSDDIEKWAMKTTLSGDWAFSSLIDTVDFQVHGEVATDGDADAFFGFGDGNNYVSLMVDFDGAVNRDPWNEFGEKTSEWGINIYPGCGGTLASGDIATVFSGASSLNSNAAYQTRMALAGGDVGNWRVMGGGDNGDTWPVAIEIENDIDHGTATVRFVSETQSLECVYNDNFNMGTDLVFGINPDSQADGSEEDKINIKYITVAKSGQNCDASAHAPMINVDAPESGSWRVELSGKDMLIAALCAINMVVLIAVICSCSRFGGAGLRKKRYAVVPVVGDSEMEQFQN